MRFKYRSLTVTIKLIIGSVVVCNVALAQRDVSESPDIPVILITALGIDENANRTVAPFSILDKKAMFERGGNLGDLLNGLPGVHADTFGGGASRPVIRGQASPRVKIMSDSSSLLDASDISPDHAVTADPLLAGGVEVLRGPATLLYGGGAVGGVVNVLDNKIPIVMPEKGFNGIIGLRGNSVANEQAGALSLTGRLARDFAVHAETSFRQVDNYKAKGWAEDRVDGTFAESANSSIGASWVGNSGFLGIAYSTRDDEYGLPGHNHEYEGCHPHGSLLHCGSHEEEGEDHDHALEEHAAVPSIDLDSKRIDLRGEYINPLPGIHRIRVRGNHTDYEHRELEEGQISSTFRNKGYEGRIELDHAPLFGWHGVVGGQLADTEFSALGAEAFIPKTRSENVGIFAVEHYELNDEWHLEAGWRHDRQEHKPIRDSRNRPAFEGSATSLSGAVIWAFDDVHTLAITLSESQRLPHAQELYARGIHLATNTYECGVVEHPLTCGGLENNAPQAKEEGSNIDIALRRHSGDLTYSVNIFSNDVDNYFYARTLDQFEDFRLIKYTQEDAEFTGAEAEVGYRFSESLAVSLFADYVRAEFANGDNLPRISPRRIGGRVNALVGAVDAAIEYYHVATQGHIASFEVATPGYDMLNTTLSFNLFGNEKSEIFVRGNNLLNEKVWNHSSFLASVVPQPGRNISAGFRYIF